MISQKPFNESRCATYSPPDLLSSYPILDCFLQTPKKCLLMVFHENQFLFQRDFLEFLILLLLSCFPNTYLSEKKSNTNQLILLHEYEKVKLSVLLMSARTEMLAQWNRQKMRTGEKLKPPILLAVPVYAALKLSKYNVKNTV